MHGGPICITFCPDVCLGLDKISGFTKSHYRVCEIRWTRRTCLANFENVRRRSLISPDKMSSAKFDIRQTFHSETNGENSKFPAKDILSGEAQMNYAYSALSKKSPASLQINVSSVQVPNLWVIGRCAHFNVKLLHFTIGYYKLWCIVIYCLLFILCTYLLFVKLYVLLE